MCARRGWLLGADENEPAEKEGGAGEENNVRLASFDHRDHQAVGDACGDGQRQPEQRRAGRGSGRSFPPVDEIGPPVEVVVKVPFARAEGTLTTAPSRRVGARCDPPLLIGEGPTTGRGEGRRGEGRRGEGCRVAGAGVVCSVGRSGGRKAGAEERAAEGRRGHDADGRDGAHGE